MYKKLTKVVNVNGRDCVACAFYDTPECQIHNCEKSCARCKMMGAILNQLHEFEEIVESIEDESKHE